MEPEGRVKRLAVERSGLDAVVQENLLHHLDQIEKSLDRDVIAIFGPIYYGLETYVRDALEGLKSDSPSGSNLSKLAVILDTSGGVAEVVERLVETIRYHYSDVAFVIPDKAMSAGTIFAMSGDLIFMDYFSRLGPIDPQIHKDGRFVPALSYLVKFNELIEKDRKGTLTNAEFLLLQKFDLAELHQFEQARQLSISLLKKWLTNYKFKNWTSTETAKKAVTPEMREERAESIAQALSDNTRWHSHSRGISKDTLESDDIKLLIDDLSTSTELRSSVRKYHHCLSDYMITRQFPFFVHTRSFI